MRNCLDLCAWSLITSKGKHGFVSCRLGSGVNGADANCTWVSGKDLKTAYDGPSVFLCSSSGMVRNPQSCLRAVNLLRHDLVGGLCMIGSSRKTAKLSTYEDMFF
eukprot:5170567-Amphidinium_carterae.1